MIFLVLILPFQLAWAGGGVYCQHEEGQATRHFGHHEHKHTAHGDQGKSDPGKLNASADNDCSSHLNGGQCFLSAPITAVLPRGRPCSTFPRPLIFPISPTGLSART